MRPNRERIAVRERGKLRHEEILDAARLVLIREGFSKLTVRRVADELGISIGNLSYYFPSKEKLVHAIIDRVIAGYDVGLQAESALFPDDPLQRFEAFLRYLVEDARRKDVQHFFYQFWGMSCHDKQLAAARNDMYKHFRGQILEMLKAINQKQSPHELELKATTVLAYIEGLHVVFGSGEIGPYSEDELFEHAIRTSIALAGISQSGK